VTIKELTDDLLDSWDRQARIVASVAKLVTEDTRKALPSPDGWPLDKQLAHIHQVRRHWLSDFDPNRAAKLGRTFTDGWDTPIDDLAAINSHLNDSAAAVRAAVSDAIIHGTIGKGAYENPVLFLQHMVWHEGWHVGLILTALRLAGHETTEEWEESHIWGLWRTEEYED